MKRIPLSTQCAAVKHMLSMLLAVLFITGAIQSVQAQVLYGSLVGRVEDQSGAVLPGARITVTNKATGQQREAVADDSGAYAFRDLQVGTYDLNITQNGFKSYTKANVLISLNTVVREDVQMSVGGASETVNITAAAPALQTDRADVSNQIDKAQITNLPIGAGRNFQQLYKLIPGASAPADAHSDAGNPQRALVTNFNGASFSNNNTRLDGATVSYPWLPHIVAYVPPQDAVETVNIVTNSFDAEQGMAGGAAVNVQIKSGTNQFHGSAYEFLRNSVFDSNNFFENRAGRDLGSFKRSQFGGHATGPIIKNKTFFMGSYEGLRARQFATRITTVPTIEQRNGDFSKTLNQAGALIRIFNPFTTRVNPANTAQSIRDQFTDNKIPTNLMDPVALNILKYFPLPNQPGDANTFANNYAASGSTETNLDNYDFRIDHRISERQTFFARYSHRYTEDVPLQSFPDSLTIAEGRVIQENRARNFVAEYNNTLSPTKVWTSRRKRSGRTQPAPCSCCPKARA